MSLFVFCVLPHHQLKFSVHLLPNLWGIVWKTKSVKLKACEHPRTLVHPAHFIIGKPKTGVNKGNLLLFFFFFFAPRQWIVVTR